MIDFTTPAINGDDVVIAIDRASSPQTVTISEGVLNSGVRIGDQIGFSWSAAANSEAFGGAWVGEEAGKIASTMCQGVSAVYGGDTTKYRCTTELRTQGESGTGMKNANPRLISSAYVGQNPASIPIQSGCAGVNAIQTNCPTPFLQTASKNYLTHVDVVNYWWVAECGCTAGLQTVQKEVSDAYKYFYGNTSVQASIMSGYVGTWSNPYVENTIEDFDRFIYASEYAWATGYGLNGLLFYEGSYAECLVAPTGTAQSASTCNEASGDKTVSVSSVTSSGSVCLLATTVTVTGYINDGKGAAPGDFTPGNVFTPTSPYTLSMYATLITGASGTPTLLGYVNGDQYNGGYVIDGPPQYVNTTTMTFAANGAVAASGSMPGMTVTITAAAGGTWSTVVGKSYTVEAVGLSQSQIPINLDCSGLGTLTSMTLTYTGSVNYINYLRNSSFSAPDQATATKQMCIVTGKYGGGCSQLGIAGVVSYGNAWVLADPDLYPYNPVASCTACTVFGTTLTLGGTVLGRYQAGQTLVGTGIGATPAITVTGVITGTVRYLVIHSACLPAREAFPLERSMEPMSGCFQHGTDFLDYNSTHGGFLLKRDVDPAANDNVPMFLNQAA